MENEKPSGTCRGEAVPSVYNVKGASFKISRDRDLILVGRCSGVRNWFVTKNTLGGLRPRDRIIGQIPPKPVPGYDHFCVLNSIVLIYKTLNPK